MAMFAINQPNQNRGSKRAAKSTSRNQILFFRVRCLAPPAAEAGDPLTLAASAEKKGRAKKHPRFARPRQRSSAKRRGEAGEALFLAKALELGYTVTKPWGDNEAYDFILDAHAGKRGLSRVQVKSAFSEKRDHGYCVSAHDGSEGIYTERDVDVLVALAVPKMAWYVIPVRDLRTYALNLFPSAGKRGSKYEKYRDAWWYLEG
jgi:hypothetical protein